MSNTWQGRANSLMIAILNVMADNKLDAIVHKTVETPAGAHQRGHQPALYQHQGSAELEYIPHLPGFGDSAVRIYRRQTCRSA